MTTSKGSSDYWYLTFTGSTRNDTNATIDLIYVSAQTADANGKIVGQSSLQPNGPGTLQPGQTVTINNSGIVESDTDPHLASTAPNWSWHAQQYYRCPAV